MTWGKCSIPGCILGDSQNRKILKMEGIKISVFSLPRDPVFLEEWKRVLRELNIELHGKDCICELHFRPEEIRKFHESKMPDGTVFQIKRGRISLKFGAVPSIFPNMSSNSAVNKSPKKSAEEGYEVKLKEKRIVYRTRVIKNTVVNVKKSKNASSDEDGFTYDELCEKLHLVKKPNNWWGFTPTDNYIIFSRWSNKYIAEKRIIIESNLKVQVYDKDLRINMTDHMKFTSIDDISALLAVVEGCKIDTRAS